MPRLEFNEEENAALARAAELKDQAKAAEQSAFNSREAREKERPLKERLTFAASSRCVCGHGFAYDPTGEVRSDKDSPFKMVSQWECSAILLGIADPKIEHSGPMPFAFWEVKSENQPSAYGRTTREPIEPKEVKS